MAKTSTIDRVFFALADATRRELLDHLLVKDGQRVGELSENFDISRQAISKHLEILKAAGLITMRRQGRETHLSLNRAPMRVAYSLWIAKLIRVSVRVDCS